MGGNDNNCVQRACCNNVALIIAIIFGIAVGILGHFCCSVKIIIGIAAFGIALIALTVLLFVALSKSGNRRDCLCTNLFQLLTGIIGTLISSLALIFSCVICLYFATAVLLGLTAFFFALTIGTFICLIICIANCRCNERGDT